MRKAMIWKHHFFFIFATSIYFKLLLELLFHLKVFLHFNDYSDKIPKLLLSITFHFLCLWAVLITSSLLWFIIDPTTWFFSCPSTCHTRCNSDHCMSLCMRGIFTECHLWIKWHFSFRIFCFFWSMTWIWKRPQKASVFQNLNCYVYPISPILSPEWNRFDLAYLV